MQYFQEEQTDSDFEGDLIDNKNEKKSLHSDISQLQIQLQHLNNIGDPIIEEELKNGSKASIHREAISDDEEANHQKESVVRKVDLLDVDNSDDEF